MRTTQIIGYEALERLSDLQRRILILITEYRDVGYKVLEQETNSDQPTLVDSCHSLQNKGLIKSIRDNPKNAKSRISFYPTEKGIYTALIHLHADYDKFARAYPEFQSVLTQLTRNPAYRKILVYAIAPYLLSRGLFNRDGTVELKELNHEKRVALWLEVGRTIFDQLKLREDDIEPLIDDLSRVLGKDFLIKMSKYYKECDARLYRLIDRLDQRIKEF